MKIYVQVVRGAVYELEVDKHTSIEEARDLLIQNYNSDFSNNLPSSSIFVIEYNFIYNGKYLFDPDPFSILKENSRTILYIKKYRPRGNYALEIAEESENENENGNEEEDIDQDMNWSNILGQRPELAPLLQRLRPVIGQIAENTLIAQAYDPQNNFWNHANELVQVENIFQGESSQAAHFISSSFLLRHFHHLFRYNDINIGTILNLMGGGPLITFGNEPPQQESNNTNNNNDANNNNDNNNNNNDNNNNNNENSTTNENDIDDMQNLYNNHIYSDYNNNEIINDLDILIMEMSKKQKNTYDQMIIQINKSSQLKDVLNQIGILKVTQIFQENGYDASKTIDLIKQIGQSQNE